MKKRRIGPPSTLSVLLSILPALLLGGCLDVHESVHLERDLSGKADFTLGVSLEPMVYFLASFERAMSGQQGEPTQADLDKQRSDMLAASKAKKSDDGASFERQRPEIEKSLPPGVHLLAGSVDDQGLKLLGHLVFGFDNIAKLAAIQLPSQGNDPRASANPYDAPFAGLRVVDEGQTVLLTMESADPKPKLEQQLARENDLTPEAKALVERSLKDARFAFQLDTRLAVVESNATRRDGSTLYWEYNLASLAKDPAARSLMVRLHK